MGKYVARRLLLIIPTLLILTMLVFGIMRVLPGDVATRMLSDEAGALSMKQFTVDALRAKLHLDRPLYLQYLGWLWDLGRGDLGESLFTGRPVRDEILQRLPITFQIALMAQILSLGIGIPVGILSAIRQNSWVDLLLRFWSIFFLAAPSFWLALLFILLAALQFNWLPPVGYHPFFEDPRSNLLQLIWPSVILSLGGLATIARMTRSTMLEVMREDYIRTARAKGLKEQIVIIRHALKNAMIPVVTLAGLGFAGLMGGTVILEQIFAIPGLGSFFINAINFRDYTIVQGAVVVFAVIFMLVNLLVDVMYGWLDPRISYG